MRLKTIWLLLISFPAIAVEQGYNFRATEGFVTDGPNETWVLATDITPTARGNFGTFAWITGTPGNANRNAGIDPRLAGINHRANGAATRDWELNLNSAGQHTVRTAFGDANAGQEQWTVFYDGDCGSGTPFITISGVNTGGGQWVDATGVLRTSESDWVNNNESVTHTFANAKLCVVMGNETQGGGSSTIAHVYVAEDFTAPTSSLPITMRYRKMLGAAMLFGVFMIGVGLIAARKRKKVKAARAFGGNV